MYCTDKPFSFCCRELEGPRGFLENVAEAVPWEERFVWSKVELIS